MPKCKWGGRVPRSQLGTKQMIPAGSLRPRWIYRQKSVLQQLFNTWNVFLPLPGLKEQVWFYQGGWQIFLRRGVWSHMALTFERHACAQYLTESTADGLWELSRFQREKGEPAVSVWPCAYGRHLWSQASPTGYERPRHILRQLSFVPFH